MTMAHIVKASHKSVVCVLLWSWEEVAYLMSPTTQSTSPCCGEGGSLWKVKKNIFPWPLHGLLDALRVSSNLCRPHYWCKSETSQGCGEGKKMGDQNQCELDLPFPSPNTHGYASSLSTNHYCQPTSFGSDWALRWHLSHLHWWFHCTHHCSTDGWNARRTESLMS